MVRAASMFSMPVPLSRTMTSTWSPCSSRTISTRPWIPWARKLEIGLSISSQRVWPKSLKLPEMPAKNSLPLGALSMFRMMISRIICSSKKCFSENKTHGAGHCPTSCGRILQHSSCPARRKRVYCPYRCGESRCVGGLITCAGAKERQLLCTAVFLLSGYIIAYTVAHIKPECCTNIRLYIC